MRANEVQIKWRFYWKNVGWFGMLWRMAAGVIILSQVKSIKDDPQTQGLLALIGGAFLLEGLLRWCPLRAILRKPSKRALRRHLPE